MALNFPTGCFGNTAWLQELDCEDVQFVLLCNSLSDGLDDYFGIKMRELIAFDLVGDKQFFLSIHEHGKGRTMVRAQCTMSSLNGPFDVLWIMIGATNDDHVFQTAGDKELAAFDKSQIAGAQKRPVAAVGEAGTKGMLGFFRALPVTFRH